MSNGGDAVREGCSFVGIVLKGKGADRRNTRGMHSVGRSGTWSKEAKVGLRIRCVLPD